MTAPAMQTIDLDRLRSDLRRYTEIAEIPFDAPTVDKAVSSLTELLTPGDWMRIGTTTKPVSSRDVSLQLSTQTQPVVPLLRQAGLFSPQGHPIENLARQIGGRLGARVSSADISVKGMADMIWMESGDGIALVDFLSLDGLPPAIHKAREHFDRAGIEHIGQVGLNFTTRSINLYRMPVSPGTFTPEQITAILTGLGFPLPAEDEIQRNATAFSLSQTFGWDSPGVMRLCFPQIYSATEFPTHYHPLLKTFVEQAPVVDDTTRDFGLYTTYGPRGGYYRIKADYTGTTSSLPRMTVSGR